MVVTRVPDLFPVAGCLGNVLGDDIAVAVPDDKEDVQRIFGDVEIGSALQDYSCLLYTSPSPRDVEESRMPSSA